MNKIAVIGDSCTDVFVYGDCYRLNPEAPTPVLKESYRKEYMGMAANVAKNVNALGLECTLITQVENIIKTRYVDEKSNYILLRIDNDNKVTPFERKDLFTYIKQFDLVIISDYDKGFLSEGILTTIFNAAKLSFIDTKKAIGPWIKDATFIKINEAEYKNPKNDLDFIFREIDSKFIVTKGEWGVSYLGKTYPPKKHITVRDVVGAGDSFLASLSCHYLLYHDIEKAIKFANVCAGEVVAQKGVAFPKQKLL